MFKTIFFSFFKDKQFKGTIEFSFDGKKNVFGNNLDQSDSKNKVDNVRLKIKDRNFFKRIIFFGDIGLGEAFIFGEFETDDLKKLFLWFIQNKEFLPGFNSKNSPSRLFEIAGFVARFSHLARKNTKTRSKKNIKSHYDVSNDFYKLWLDETMTYSCGIFNDTDDLKTAQLNKYRAICEKAELKPTDHILEIGSGWGGFACFAVENYGCKVTTVTISNEQFAYAKNKIEKKGFSDKIEIVLKDYRDIEGSFDKIISIEMMEAIGNEFVPMFIKKCKDVLSPGGKMVFQIIAYPNDDFEAYLKNNNYIKKYIFPGGELLYIPYLKRYIKEAGGLNILAIEEIGPDYAKTLYKWRKNMEAKKTEVLGLGFNEEFYRKWYYYFAYCEAGFEALYLGDVQISILKNK